MMERRLPVISQLSLTFSFHFEHLLVKQISVPPLLNLQYALEIALRRIQARDFARCNVKGTVEHA